MLHLYINLNRSKDRRKLIESDLSRFNISINRITAVDGEQLSESFINKIKPSQYSIQKAWFPYQLIANEYACFLSHKKCWDELIKSNHKYALILEDDIKLTPNAEKFIINSNWIPENINLISLCAPLTPKQFRVKNHSIDLEAEFNSKIFEIISPSITSAAAYIISRDAATVALSLSEKISAPVDEYLFSPKSPLRKKIPIFKLYLGIGFQRGSVSTITTLPRNGRKPFLSRLHPVALLCKIKLLTQEMLYRRKIDFYTPKS